MERALGLCWSVESDTFGFKIRVGSQPPTRRGILSMVSSIYDPLGFAAPFILPAKCLLQDLCRRGIGWDDAISESELNRWQKWLEDLPELQNLKIPRCFKPELFGKAISCQIHTYSDASQVGYGIVSYLRLINGEGRIHCSLLMGKARVAPLKKVTIPRMELTAATVAICITKMVVRQLEMKNFTGQIAWLFYVILKTKKAGFIHMLQISLLLYVKHQNPSSGGTLKQSKSSR